RSAGVSLGLRPSGAACEDPRRVRRCFLPVSMWVTSTTRQLRTQNQPLWFGACFRTECLGDPLRIWGRGAGFPRFLWLTGREGESHWHRLDPASYPPAHPRSHHSLLNLEIVTDRYLS